MPFNQHDQTVWGWKLDHHGVPVLSRENLEELADDFLSRFDPDMQTVAKPLNHGKVMHSLRDDYGVNFVFNRFLGRNQSGEAYAGFYEPRLRQISIDVSLAYRIMQWRFVLFHEIGHFLLHSHLGASDVSLESTRRIDIGHKFRNIDNKLRTPKEWLEYQANTFASCVLVPHSTVQMELIRLQLGRGILLNKGRIFVDSQRQNQLDFHELLVGLGHRYQVSKTVIKNRLQALGLLTIETPKPATSSIHAAFNNISRWQANSDDGEDYSHDT